MFSGIIERLGTVQKVTRESASLQLEINTHATDLSLGESVAVNGVCLTVTHLEGSVARFDVSPETVEKTQLKTVREKDHVNLERSLRNGERNSGHWVQGHVDQTGTVLSVETLDSETSRYTRVRIQVPQNLFKYCIQKGSIAIDGTSLTINSMGDTPQPWLEVMIVPHTFEATLFQTYRPKTLVNIEVDCLAKYVESLCLPWFESLQKQRGLS
jgi:riboflavin synthase